MKLFFDTNILMDIVFERPICIDEEGKILQLAFKEQLQIVVSALSFVNTIYVAKKYDKSIDDVKKVLFSLSKHINVIDISGKSAVDMLSNAWNDYEDGLQYLCAMNSKSDIIITRNKKDFKLSNIPVYTPQEFLDLIEDN
jgi:predicted nucleic acid-binding protein